MTTATNPTTSEVEPHNPRSMTLFDSAADALSYLDDLLEQANVEPSKAVVATRAALDDIANDEAQQLDSVDQLADAGGLSMGQAIDTLAQLQAGTTTTNVGDRERVEAIAKLLGTGTPEQARTKKRLINRAKFHHGRKATLQLRKLGDGIVDGLFQPWAARITGELAPLTEVMTRPNGRTLMFEAQKYAAENNYGTPIETHLPRLDYSAVQPHRSREHFMLLRGMELTAEFLHVVEVAHNHRERGLMPSPTEPIPAVSLSFRRPDRLHVLDLIGDPLFDACWIAHALRDGASPTVLTAKQAIKTHPDHRRPNAGKLNTCGVSASNDEQRIA